MKHLAIVLLLASLVACSPSPKVVWKVQTRAPVMASPSIFGNLLVIGSTDFSLYAIEKSNGKVVWSQNLGERIYSRPLVSARSIYVGGGKDLICLNGETGKIVWRYSTGDLIQYDPCEDADAVYVGSNDHHFYKISKTTGEKKWAFESGGEVWGSCVVYDKFIITGSWDAHLYGIERETGNAAWNVFAIKPIYGSPDLLRDSVYFATHTNLFQIDAATGKLLNRVSTKYMDYAIVNGDSLLTPDSDGLSRRTLQGAEISRIDFPAAPSFRPVIAGDQLIMATREHKLYGISKDLKIQWKFKADDAFWSPGVVENGTYYTGNFDGSIYALTIPQ